MPSSSIIWIALVAVWLFVLVPMLVSKRPRIRQTTDAALATRVLFRGGMKRPVRGPAVGHRSDPNWEHGPTSQSSDTHGSDTCDSELHGDMYGTDAEDRMDAHAETETVDGRVERDFVPSRRGRGGFDPEADAIARAERYRFRQRAVLGLVFAALLTAGLAVALTPIMWWVFAASFCGLVGYLAYLRRQVTLEQEIRRRRMARLGRSRTDAEYDDEYDDAGYGGAGYSDAARPSRVRRPGAVVLEVDDEDPAFDHLEHYDAEIARHDGRGHDDGYAGHEGYDDMRRAM
ncbi:gephyrin-like molybdotransferase receptor GlpR [Prescottella sp. R16]|uniref:divisome protein SepX/GlpR n=1 Tax=Prescottella sp. R16 TaxID=3064529 RepID=UPI00272E3B7C|nr:gephyrin-like molybdotransferase receptor GlpR [Prescottella sp. R16]